MKRTLIPKGYTIPVLLIVVFLSVLFLVSGLDLLPPYVLSHDAALLLQYVMYCLMISAWMLSSSARLYHPRIKRLHGLLCLDFFVILMLSRLRHVVLAGVYPWEHLLWYLFYLPTLTIPLLSFYMTLYVGRDDAWELPGKLKLLLVPSAFLFFGILTNEWHELAFRLADKGEATSLALNYHVSWLYFLAQGWYLLFTVLSLARLVRVCRENDLRIYILPQAVVIFFGILYTVLYAIDRSPAGFGYVEPAIASCTVSIGVWEASLLTGMIPNNRGHAAFFRASTVPMELTDKNGTVRFVSAGNVQPGRTYRTKTMDFPEGALCYREDVTELEETLCALGEAEENTREANRKLEADAQVRNALVRMSERVRLYAAALADTRDRIEAVRQRAAQTVPEAAVPDCIAQLCVPLAYIKRRGNLVLTEEATGVFPASELHYCLRESVEALSLIPVSVVYTQETDETQCYSAKSLKALYDAFESAVEEALPHLETMRMKLEADAEEVRLFLEMEGDGMERRQMRVSAGKEEPVCA